MTNQIVIPLHQSNEARYKAEVRTCAPASAKQGIGGYSTCFVGISLENPAFLGNKLSSIVTWISERFDDCVFLLGDNVHRLTLQIRQNLSEKDSQLNALGLGDFYLRTHQHLLVNSVTGKPFKVIRGSDIYSDSLVSEYRERLTDVFETSDAFRGAIEHFASQFIQRNETPSPLDHNLSCRYVIEELAETCYMASINHGVLVYPGSLAIFEQISENYFVNAGLPDDLDNLITIGLRLKRRGSKKSAVAMASASA